jgi:aspartate/methionine/tyrosine aminotransferase
LSQVHPVYAAMGTTIFERMSAEARALGAINLGQGFPDDQGPPELLAAAARALTGQSNQYPPSTGLPSLREAICTFYGWRQKLYMVPEQVIVTSGATEALAAAILALVNPGDEVILFQPAYDAYGPLVRRAGGMPVSVPLAPPHWRYDAGLLDAVITERTKLLILNDPLNPSGTVASEAELAGIADVCIRRNLIALCDEVWEGVRFDDAPHRSLLSFPGMAERAVKVGSAGKIFGLTGWKIGWLCASPALARALGRAHQFLTFTTPPALQWAVAEGLMLPQAWFAAQRAAWAASRARLKSGLEQAGYVVPPNAATWFVCVDLQASGIALPDRKFSERALREAGVASIPVSGLFEGEGPTNVVRLCFTKSDATLDDAVERLAGFRRALA